MRKLAIAARRIALSLSSAMPAIAVHATANDNATAQIIGEVFANGQQMNYLSMLSDEIGSRLIYSWGVVTSPCITASPTRPTKPTRAITRPAWRRSRLRRL